MQRVRIFDAQRNEITDDALNSTAQPMLDGEIAEVVQLMQPPHIKIRSTLRKLSDHSQLQANQNEAQSSYTSFQIYSQPQNWSNFGQ